MQIYKLVDFPTYQDSQEYHPLNMFSGRGINNSTQNWFHKSMPLPPAMIFQGAYIVHGMNLLIK